MKYRSSEVDELFSSYQTIRKYVEIEIALAKVQAELGIIPETAAKSISEHISANKVDLKQYHKDAEMIGFPLVGLIKQLNQQVPNDLGEYLHWGATTQDIMDTGLILTLKDVINLLEKEIVLLIHTLKNLAEQHKSTLMVGRSQLQQAVPITFGYKVAEWLAPILRHKERLAFIKSRILNLQFGGAVGTLASLGEIGFSVREKLAERLHLNVPSMSWHTQRDDLVEFSSFIGLLTGSLSKIAQDILLMTQSEVSELTELGYGKSSTMPHKRNPINTQKVLLAGKLARKELGPLYESMVQDHERGAGNWQLEWTLIPNCISYGHFAIQTLNTLLSESIQVNEPKMEINLKLSDDMIYAEGIMMILASSMGRQKAHHLLDQLISETHSSKKPFKEVLSNSNSIKSIITDDLLENIFSGEIHRVMAAKSVELLLKKD